MKDRNIMNNILFHLYFLPRSKKAKKNKNTDNPQIVIFISYKDRFDNMIFSSGRKSADNFAMMNFTL